MIISASRRTDIPCFYSEWLMNRIRKGFCYVPNPLYPTQKTNPVSLKPEDVEIIVFWTRDPEPLIKYLPELDRLGYRYYFQYTLLGYPSEIDSKSPSLGQAIKTFCKLSDRIGKEKVIWRYDPILFSTITDYQWHRRQIKRIANRLKSKTERLVISFIDPYRKTIRRLKEETKNNFRLLPGAFDPESYKELAGWIAKEMRKIDVEVVTCSESADLSSYGIGKGKCIDDELISRILRRKIIYKKDPAQRDLCGCTTSKDIGATNTCILGCKYCYAIDNTEVALKNFKEHDVDYPSMVKWYPVEAL